MSQIVSKTDERVVRFFKALERMATKLEYLVRSFRPRLGGECYLTDSEVASLLKISRRTLQEWRNTGLIPYVLLGGKVLYLESDLQKLLDAHYHKSWSR